MSMQSDDLRTQARKRLEERRGFFPHLIVYVSVNVTVVIIWATAADAGFFWPGFVIGFWGVGLLMHAWNAFFRTPITEADIQRELDRMGRHAHVG